MSCVSLAILYWLDLRILDIYCILNLEVLLVYLFWFSNLALPNSEVSDSQVFQGSRQRTIHDYPIICQSLAITNKLNHPFEKTNQSDKALPSCHAEKAHCNFYFQKQLQINYEHTYKYECECNFL